MNIDGIEYVKASDISSELGEHICVIATNGWIFEGYADDPNASNITLRNASVVRKWSNGKGIGGIAKEENSGDYTLDWCGTVCIHRIVAVVGIEW